MSALGIGSIVWYRDECHRVYVDGRSGPTERGYWIEAAITGESPRMWVVDRARKIPKNGKIPAGFATTPAEVERAVWVAENRYAVARAVERLHNGVVTDSAAAYAKLAAVAEIVGYEPSAPR